MDNKEMSKEAKGCISVVVALFGIIFFAPFILMAIWGFLYHGYINNTKVTPYDVVDIAPTKHMKARVSKPYYEHEPSIEDNGKVILVLKQVDYDDYNDNIFVSAEYYNSLEPDEIIEYPYRGRLEFKLKEHGDEIFHTQEKYYKQAKDYLKKNENKTVRQKKLADYSGHTIGF